MSEPRFRFAPILLEASFVVLGVFLALVANEWRTNAQAERRAERARVGILEEITTNRAELQRSLEYHTALMDSLRPYFPADAPRPSPRLFSQGFIRPATLLTTAWDAANATGAVGHMDYEDVLALSAWYAQQSRYQNATQEVSSTIYAEIMERGVPGVSANFRNLVYLIGTFTYLERSLLTEYDSLATTLEIALPDSAGFVPSGTAP